MAKIIGYTTGGVALYDAGGGIQTADPTRAVDTATETPITPAAPVAPTPVAPVVAPAPVAATPVATTPVAPTPTPPPTYTVQPGDSLNAVAKRLGVQATDISGYRSGDPNVIYPKEVLTIQPRQTQPITKSTTTDTTDTTEPIAPVDTSPDEQALAYLTKQYGLSFSSGDFANNPQKSIKDLVSEVMTATGLPDVKTRITDITSEIEKLNNQRDAEIADINDNPWLSESKRSALIGKITTAYENKTNNKVNTLKLLQDTYDSARQEAQFAATAAINLYDRQGTFDQNKLEFLITQTEKRIEARNKLQEPKLGPTSVQEYEYAVKQGYKGTFNQYQNEDANRKAKALGGGLTPAQINTTVNSIAGAFDNEPTVKEYNTVKKQISTYNSLGNTATDDILRVYAFAKVADPSSAVKEGEYASIEKYSQALLSRAGLKVNRVFSATGILTPEARTAMGTTLQKGLDSSKVTYDQVSSEYQRQIDDAYAGKARTITDYTPPNQNTSGDLDYTISLHKGDYKTRELLIDALVGSTGLDKQMIANRVYFLIPDTK